MASGWDPALKKVVRTNGRNVGPVIWDQDAIAGQVIDSQGHDTNDQTLADSISETLNINGINSMLSDLDVGSHKVINVANGVNPLDAVNVSQLQAVGGGGLITSQSWDGTSFTSTRVAEAPFTTDMQLKASIKSRGKLRHLLTNAGLNNVVINPDIANRYTVQNNSAMSVTMTYPSGADPQLGENYQLEGSVMFENVTGVGLVTLVGVDPSDILGVQPLGVGDKYLLSYIVQIIGGTVNELWIWSAG